MLSTTDVSIIAQVSAKIGAEAAQATYTVPELAGTVSYDEMFKGIADLVFEWIISTVEPFNVAQQLPGAQQVTPQPVTQPAAVVNAPTNVAPIQSAPSYQPQAAPVAAPAVGGPAPVPGVSNAAPADAEALWQDLFANPPWASPNSPWEDVRSQKRSEKSPDFRHRTMLDPNNPPGKSYKVSLWVNGKGTPAWVTQAFTA